MSGSSKITRFALAPGVRCLKANRFHFSRKLDLTDRGVFPSSAGAQFKASRKSGNSHEAQNPSNNGIASNIEA